MRRQITLTLLMLLLAGCGHAATPAPAPAPAADPAPTATPAPPAAPPPAASAPELRDSWPGDWSRTQLRDGLERLMNAGEGSPADKLKRLFSTYPTSEPTPWAAADLDGDSQPEYVVAAAVTDPGRSAYTKGMGAALFVVYQKDGRYQVDVSERMNDRYEVQLMSPTLHAIADLTGSGTPQVLWSRPEMIATGPQPIFLFLTTWRPGALTTRDGEMAIASTRSDRPTVSVDGKEIVLTGGTRQYMFLRPRVDRYRYVDGAFRLVDRRFTESGDDAYSRFWDGLIAEDVDRLADAEAAYREALEPTRPVHPGTVPRYNQLPLELTKDEVTAFGDSLHALVRFRLGALLLASGRQKEAAALLQQAPGPYQGLAEALLNAGDRQRGCEAAATWAQQDPHFLPALNRGVSHNPWEPKLLCTHVEIDDHIP